MVTKGTCCLLIKKYIYQKNKKRLPTSGGRFLFLGKYSIAKYFIIKRVVASLIVVFLQNNIMSATLYDACRRY